MIVVNGAGAGTRYPLSGNEILIGRSPNSTIVLSEPEIGWRHCQIRRLGDRYIMIDGRTATGTYVNGMRSAERWLSDRDQLGIGKTILTFRTRETAGEWEDAEEINHQPKPILLAACSLVFLFRALAASASEAQTRLLEQQVLHLVSDLVPVAGSVLLFGNTIAELLERRMEIEGHISAEIRSIVERICYEGAISDPGPGVVGVPLYLNGSLGGALIAEVKASDAARLDRHLETMTAIASLATVGFEANKELEVLRAENALLQEQISARSGIVGKSPAIERLLTMIRRIAPRDTTVLIMGESGTGKELVARALHEGSGRRERAFVAVNCAALSENLFESELFGHEKGAFTGAVAQRSGRLELAQGGTIFLDEVGELALPLQAKLLRVIQEREYERVGGSQAHSLDVRVIAATNRDLLEEVREGKFREDLYHRLNVISIMSPPLRDRRDDIPLLAQYFLERSAERCKRSVHGLSDEAVQVLEQYSWPGNVRELENAMERAVVLGVSDTVLPEDLPESLLESAPREVSARYHSSVGQAKREAILEAYAQGSGDYKQAARLLGLHPNYLLRLVRNMNLREEIQRATNTFTSRSVAGS